jgi:hypothetical protein
MKAVHGDYCSTSLKEKQVTFPFKSLTEILGIFSVKKIVDSFAELGRVGHPNEERQTQIGLIFSKENRPAW